jgi:hypothetical protein
MRQVRQSSVGNAEGDLGAEDMTKEAMKLALEALETSMYPQQKQLQAITALREALAKPDFWEGYVPEPVKPAQQEPKIDIYRSFEQWKSGNVLEHGVPRTEFYTKADLDLVEMGWRYGYDAGRAVEQALDKKAENARELGLDYEPIRQPQVRTGDCLLVGVCASEGHKIQAQRTWVGLTDEELDDIYQGAGKNDLQRAQAIEAKLKEKNT